MTQNNDTDDVPSTFDSLLTDLAESERVRGFMAAGSEHAAYFVGAYLKLKGELAQQLDHDSDPARDLRELAYALTIQHMQHGRDYQIARALGRFPYEGGIDDSSTDSEV